MTSALKHLIAFAVMLLVVGGSYYVFVQSDVMSGATMRADDVERVTDDIEKNVLADLALLRRLDLESTLFVMPEYTALVDSRVIIGPAPVSRTNPFIPR